MKDINEGMFSVPIDRAGEIDAEAALGGDRDGGGDDGGMKIETISETGASGWSISFAVYSFGRAKCRALYHTANAGKKNKASAISAIADVLTCRQGVFLGDA